MFSDKDSGGNPKEVGDFPHDLELMGDRKMKIISPIICQNIFLGKKHGTKHFFSINLFV